MWEYAFNIQVTPQTVVAPEIWVKNTILGEKIKNIVESG